MTVLLGASDLVNLYSAVQTTVDTEEKRKRANEFDDAVAANIRELFGDPRYPRRRRSFGVIRKSFGGYFDDDPKELHKHLIRIGASHKKGSNDDALWHLPDGAGYSSHNLMSWGTIGAIAAVISAMVAVLEYMGFGPSDWFTQKSEIEQWLGRE